jgi:hypothetical protein
MSPSCNHPMHSSNGDIRPFPRVELLHCAVPRNPLFDRNSQPRGSERILCVPVFIMSPGMRTARDATALLDGRAPECRWTAHCEWRLDWKLQDFGGRSAPDTPMMTELWFKSILAPTRIRNWAGERLGYVPPRQGRKLSKVQLPVKPNLHSLSIKFGASRVGSRWTGVHKPCSGTLRFHKSSGGNTDLNTRTPPAGCDPSAPS